MAGRVDAAVVQTETQVVLLETGGQPALGLARTGAHSAASSPIVVSPPSSTWMTGQPAAASALELGVERLGEAQGEHLPRGAARVGQPGHRVRTDEHLLDHDVARVIRPAPGIQRDRLPPARRPIEPWGADLGAVGQGDRPVGARSRPVPRPAVAAGPRRPGRRRSASARPDASCSSRTIRVNSRTSSQVLVVRDLPAGQPCDRRHRGGRVPRPAAHGDSRRPGWRTMTTP